MENIAQMEWLWFESSECPTPKRKPVDRNWFGESKKNDLCDFSIGKITKY